MSRHALSSHVTPDKVQRLGAADRDQVAHREGKWHAYLSRWAAIMGLTTIVLCCDLTLAAELPSPVPPMTGPPNRRMTELTIGTALRTTSPISDDAVPAAEPDRYLVTFDTQFTNGDLRFSYAKPALGFQHHPLYFEDVALERDGATCGPVLDPLFSGLHFYGTVAIMPYKMAVRHPDHPVATYGRREDFFRDTQRDLRFWPSHPTVRSCMGVAVETLVVSALVFGL